MIGAVASSLLFTGCTPEEHALASGMAIGAATGLALSSYSYPYYYNRPYYYYGGRYMYGGYYRGGYYHYHGRRYRSGHYYNNGYRYYNGRRYRAQSGRYGYYRNKSEYNRYRKQTRNVNNRYNRNKSYNSASHSRSNYNRSAVRSRPVRR